jgi:DNA-binding transcriptional LysR family regulator
MHQLAPAQLRRALCLGVSKDGRDLHVRVEGQFVVNNINTNLKAVEAGLGLAIVMEDQITTHIAQGNLVRVLEDWCPPFSGYHIYYPAAASFRRHSRPFCKP